ncbi:PilC/PilY family type IV pilus protein [Cocleimonas sp. KMM 6892]|uniref:pilus assembly protein n=1 Tax=unclassified Cocleimonas TaxID=2639732 RepID=UPI002DB7839F|nr:MULTISPECIES: PilC/PilY family type IV pilus protein [unclassified Cocleimonas]MEB8433835.1 PilC/PilY family type IV pilus protein [Cocleimonas sp. KMM 6892]MEC4716646.1 PilC/PilY family type IV pilus protein [Cocleimonas sp. KMM 6895]MEC4746199.1 PilC/PilY family type IV pilus protein [Cocleimonas sp. KMM 6896]
MKRLVKYLISMIVLSISVSVSADDTDILDTPTSANILFVMDLSGSMGWGKEQYSTPSASDPARVDVLRGAFQAIVANSEFDSMNFGLSIFSGGAQSNLGASVAHGISYPVSPITGNAQEILNREGYTHPGVSPDNSYMPAAAANTSREYLSLLSSPAEGIWEVGGSTPMVDALYEAALYFRGEGVHWGKYAPKDIRSAHPSTYTGTGNPFREVVTTVTPECTLETRNSCTKGSCGSTESCGTSYEVGTRFDSTGGINCSTNTGRTCSTYGTTCGLGTNCSSETDVPDRWCNSNISTVAECEANNPSWHSCSTYESTECSTDVEGQSVCSAVTRVKCKETLTITRCDASDTYTCDYPVEKCTKCPDPYTESVVEGSESYKSPIIDKCSNNGVIFLTDGEPTENSSADLIASMIDASGTTYSNGCEAPVGSGVDLYGRCGPELAKFLATEDQASGSTAGSIDVPGIQTIQTHIVGLALDETSATAQYLNRVTDSSGGSFLIADDEATLVEAFKQLINSIAGKARSFAAPSYSVDTSTLLSHGNSVYVPMFDKRGTVWPGNLKKFQLINGELMDKAGNSATDEDGSILSTARDMWTDTTATPKDAISSGGAANKIDPAERLSISMKTNIGGSLVKLSSATNDDFGVGTTNAEKDEFLKYISGTNNDDTPRNHMGDIMHSKPIQLEIAKTTGNEKVIFVGSNEGFLHAINDADGTEAFTFMPRELIKNIKPQYYNTVLSRHIYGVDSPITLWIDDRTNATITRGNGVLDVDDGEKAYIFFGLRRGGKGYYALNVTDPTDPKLLWTSEFGDGNSWSQPVVKMLKRNASSDPAPVLIFGGGYIDDSAGDEVLDQANAVYIVDALGGPSTFSKTITTTESYSIPSNISVLDIDNNGSVDRLYFGDTGGYFWRVDLDAGKADSPSTPYDLAKAELHKFADLGGAGTVKRKFFEEPSIAVFKNKGKPIITIAIGSGDRTNPLSESVEDKFFVLYDKEVFNPPASTTTEIEMADLSPSTDTFNISLDSFKGWYKDLTSTNGEKVLSSAITYQNKIFFTTFGKTAIDPATPSTICVEPNESRLYILDLNAGTEYSNTKASSGEILGTPQLIFPAIDENNCEAGNCERAPVKVCAGYCGPGNPAITVDGVGGSPVNKALQRVYWIDNE